MGQSRANAKNLNDVNSWKSTSITQFELSKVIYTSGFLQKCNLTATAKLVLMALIQHYNANNPDMFPSQKFLAQQLGISEKSVERAILNLKDEDYIYYVTQRVNRYRFTAHFFESVKMSVQNRQNVGSQHRQNVGQTNKEEKRKEKESFLNFSSFGISLDKKNFGNGAKAPQTSDFDRALKEDLRQMAEKNDEFSLRRAEKNSRRAATGGAQNHQEEASWPLDWSREDALKWVQSLAPVFRTRGIAKTLTQKHGYTEKELWGEGGNPYPAADGGAGAQEEKISAV